MTLPMIPSSRTELSASYIAAINRVLYDIANELNRDDANAKQAASDTDAVAASSAAVLPIRIVFKEGDTGGSAEAIIVTPVPIQFDRSFNVWSQAAVLDWAVYEKDPDVATFNFPRNALLAGFLIQYLDERKNLTDSAPSHLIGIGSSRNEEHSKEWSLLANPPWPSDETKSATHAPVVRPQSVASASIKGKGRTSAEIFAALKPLYLDELDRIDPLCPRYVVLMPVYDLCPHGLPLGLPIACLLLNVGRTGTGRASSKCVTNEIHEAYAKACDEVAERFVPRLRRRVKALAMEIQKAAMLVVSREQPKEHRDLLEHFVAVLTHVQIWDKVHVFRNDKHLYSYGWKRADQAKCEEEWTRVHPVGLGGGNSLASGKFLFAPFGLPNSRDLSRLLGKSPTNLWAEKALSIVDDCGLGRLDEFEDDALRGCTLVFEFTKAAVLPSRDATHCVAFCRELVHQQLDVLRAALPMVRRRKAAIRNAVSGIMGRNTSHNIGSHVLARLAADELGDATTDEDSLRRRARARAYFLSYLQRRMDFLAEIATSDVAYWSQAMTLAKAVEPLDFDAQYSINSENECRTGDAALPADPIVLSYITGRPGLRATVKHGGNVGAAESPWFACPGGEVGAHALLVILENIIRNSARHASDANGVAAGACLELSLQVDEVQVNDEESLMSLEIVDSRTELDEWGYVKSARRDGCSLPEAINNILEKGSLLRPDGTPDPSNWGVREMQICAHYLRMRPLSTLESGAPPAPAVLRAHRHTLGPKKYCLSYILYLQRPRRLAVVVANGELDAAGETCTVAGRDDNAVRAQSDTRLGIAVEEVSEEADTKTNWPQFVRDRQLAPYEFLIVSEKANALFAESAASASARERTAWSVHVVCRPIDHICKWLGAMRDGDMEFGAGAEIYRAIWEKTRDRHVPWAGRPLYGAWLENKPAPPLQSTPTAGAVVSFNKRSYCSFQSLTPPTNATATTSNDPSLAVAWIDHATNAVAMRTWLDAIGAAITDAAQASVEPVFAEGAYSESVHRWSSNLAPWWAQELLAAALPRVAVLDERAQAERSLKYRDVELHHRWRGMGVWVPDKDDPAQCNLVEPNLRACQTFLECSSTHSGQGPVDYLVIHLTVLEALVKQCKGEKTLAAALKQLMPTALAEDPGVEVVIVTGRGVAGTVMSNGDNHLGACRYLPLSALHENLILRPSKLGLMRTLWSARRARSRADANGGPDE